jgi:hypothetical protein
VSTHAVTQIPGHGLKSEGKPYGPGTTGYGGHMRIAGRVGYALCSCGEISPDLESDNARKRWHKEHKQRDGAV